MVRDTCGALAQRDAVQALPLVTEGEVVPVVAICALSLGALTDACISKVERVMEKDVETTS
jgi:hypothetical protein